MATYVDYDLLRVRGVSTDPPPEVGSPLNAGDQLVDYTSPATDFATLSDYHTYPGTPTLAGAPWPSAASAYVTFTLPIEADDPGVRVAISLYCTEKYPYEAAQNVVLKSSIGGDLTRSADPNGVSLSADAPSPGSGATVSAWVSLEYIGTGGVLSEGLGYMTVKQPVCIIYDPAEFEEEDPVYNGTGDGPDISASVSFVSLDFTGAPALDYWNLPATEPLDEEYRPVMLNDFGATLQAYSSSDYYFYYLSNLADPDLTGAPDPLKRYFVR